MKIGDKVVCVNDSPCCDCGIKHGYIKNNVYVISAVRGTDDGTGSIGVRCIGVNYHPNCGTGYNSSRRFRLLDELKEQNAIKQRQAQVA
jgi:hypothetical protein